LAYSPAVRTLSLHDALPIYEFNGRDLPQLAFVRMKLLSISAVTACAEFGVNLTALCGQGRVNWVWIFWRLGVQQPLLNGVHVVRSEERRVGKECRWWVVRGQ